MSKIIFGDQHDKSKSRVNIVSAGGTSEIRTGQQFDESIQEGLILDLPDLPPNIDVNALAAELGVILRSMNTAPAPPTTDAAESLKQAESAAKRGDRTATVAFLQKAGTWALDIAKSVGATVASAAIKASLGL